LALINSGAEDKSSTDKDESAVVSDDKTNSDEANSDEDVIIKPIKRKHSSVLFVYSHSHLFRTTLKIKEIEHCRHKI
jgi:hypothetical protein